MKLYVSILLLILPSIVFGQSKILNGELLCFERNFIDSIHFNDTINVSVFYFDNSPIKFKRNGKFKRVKAPVVMCANTRKQKSKIDNLSGCWSLNINVLTMTTKTKTIELQVVEQTKDSYILKV